MNMLNLLPLFHSFPNSYNYDEYEALYNHFNLPLEIDPLIINIDSNLKKLSDLSLNSLFEYEGDEDIVGDYLFVYKNKPFALCNRRKEGYTDYIILDRKTYILVYFLLLDFTKKVNDSNIFDNLPLIKNFDKPYNLFGENLLYLDPQNNLHLITSYVLSKDYSNPFVNIIVNGIYLNVDFKYIFSVINDNLKIAKMLINKQVDYLPYIPEEFKTNETILV